MNDLFEKYQKPPVSAYNRCYPIKDDDHKEIDRLAKLLDEYGFEFDADRLPAACYKRNGYVSAAFPVATGQPDIEGRVEFQRVSASELRVIGMVRHPRTQELEYAPYSEQDVYKLEMFESAVRGVLSSIRSYASELVAQEEKRAHDLIYGQHTLAETFIQVDEIVDGTLYPAIICAANITAVRANAIALAGGWEIRVDSETCAAVERVLADQGVLVRIEDGNVRS